MSGLCDIVRERADFVGFLKTLACQCKQRVHAEAKSDTSQIARTGERGSEGNVRKSN